MKSTNSLKKNISKSDSLKLKYNKDPVKGDIDNLRNLKIVVDDILLDYITRVLNKKMKSWFEDCKIVIGILSTIISAIVVYMSMYYEFKEYKGYLVICLVLYFILNGIIYICDLLRTPSFQFNDLKLCTSINVPSTIYTILVYKGDKLIPEKWDRSLCDMFYEDGVFNSDMFIDEMDKVFN